MNISKKFLLAVTSLLVLQGAAFAQTMANNGWYIGGSVGRSSIKPDVGSTAGLPEDKTGTGIKILGGYQFNQNVAVEGQYQDLGKYTLGNSAASLKVKERGLAVAAVGFLPLENNFSLIGKGGIVIHRYRADAAAAGITITDTETKSSAFIGFGAEYDLNPKVALRAEYEYFGKPNVNGTRIKSDLFSVGLRYRF